jgi:hypothetical protein
VNDRSRRIAALAAVAAAAAATIATTPVQPGLSASAQGNAFALSPEAPLATRSVLVRLKPAAQPTGKTFSGDATLVAQVGWTAGESSTPPPWMRVRLIHEGDGLETGPNDDGVLSAGGTIELRVSNTGLSGCGDRDPCEARLTAVFERQGTPIGGSVTVAWSVEAKAREHSDPNVRPDGMAVEVVLGE